MHQLSVLVVPSTLIFLELFSGAELLADAEHTGEDTLGRDLQIGREEGPPVEGICCPALEAEYVVDRGNHQIEILLPVNETPGRLFALAPMTWIYEIGEGLESGFCVRWLVYIKHLEQGLGLIRVGEIRIFEHHEDLEDHAEIGAGKIFSARNRDCI